jgi:hypothetical protein
VQQIEAQFGQLMKKLGYALVSQPTTAVSPRMIHFDAIH